MLDVLLEALRDVVLATLWLGTEMLALAVGSAVALTGVTARLRRRAVPDSPAA
jgi:hypothetical protein